MKAAMSPIVDGGVVALCGGIGGAKLALGLARVVPPERLSVIVNTGDDFHHLGLTICPDLDTVTYTLAGKVNPGTGWGRKDETWRFMEAVAELGGETWFNLGDTDLATHALRSAMLERGARLTEATAHIGRALGVPAAILPATDDPLRTYVETDEGRLPFQKYFVERCCAPSVTECNFEGAADVRPTPEVIHALSARDLQAVVICPSNPYLSIDPMLAVPGFRDLLLNAAAPVVAVSPIVGGTAIKGPLAKMMTELGLVVSSRAIANHYRDLIDLFIIDQTDRNEKIRGPVVEIAQTVMRTLDDRTGLARTVLALAAREKTA